MGKHVRHRYVDLANSSMSIEVMDSVFKFYRCMLNSEYTLTFRNVSDEERDYLTWLGVDEKHIRGIRKEAESSEDLRFAEPESGII